MQELSISCSSEMELLNICSSSGESLWEISIVPCILINIHSYLVSIQWAGSNRGVENVSEQSFLRNYFRKCMQNAKSKLNLRKFRRYFHTLMAKMMEKFFDVKFRKKELFFNIHRHYGITQFKLEKTMERLPLFLTALVAVIILSACSHPQSVQVSPPEQLSIATSDNGTKVNAFVGQNLVITLNGNPSTGYTWETKDLDPTMFLQDGETQFTSSNPNLVGSGGTQTLTIKTLKTGTATLTLDYHRPWETGVAPADTFSVVLLIK